MVAHQQQKQQKRLMVGMVNQLADSLRGNNDQTGGLTLKPAMPVPLQNLAGTVEQILTPPEEEMGDQPGARKKPQPNGGLGAM
jgi:hypothetical protein